MDATERTEPIVDVSPESLTAVEAGYRQILDLLAPLASSGSQEEAHLMTLEQETLWTTANAMGELLELAYIPPGLDLTIANDEGTRKALQAFIRWRHFTPHPLGDPGTSNIPRYTAEDCQLEVYYQHGRWFATWLKLEEVEPDAKECDLRELVSFDHRPDERRLILVEVA